MNSNGRIPIDPTALHERVERAVGEAVARQVAAVDAGIMQQVDWPDLAMGRHTQYRELSVAGFRAALAQGAEKASRTLWHRV